SLPLQWRRLLRRRPKRTSMPASRPRKFSPTLAARATAVRGKSGQPARPSCGNIIPPAGGEPPPRPPISPRAAVVPGRAHQGRPPTLGAGQAAAPGTDQGNGRRTSEQGQPSPGAAGAVRPRRPTESVEAGSLPIAVAPGGAAEAGAPQAAVATPARQNALEGFEE